MWAEDTVERMGSAVYRDLPRKIPRGMWAEDTVERMGSAVYRDLPRKIPSINVGSIFWNLISVLDGV
jgi:hypothetical protein